MDLILGRFSDQFLETMTSELSTAMINNPYEQKTVNLIDPSRPELLTPSFFLKKEGLKTW